MKTVTCDFCHKEIKRTTIMPPEPKVKIQFEKFCFEFDCCTKCGIEILRSWDKEEEAMQVVLREGIIANKI